MSRTYLANYAEDEARAISALPARYAQVLVIPAYRENAAVADRLKELATRVPALLVILVLNRPSTDATQDPNRALRDTLAAIAFGGEPALLRYMEDPPVDRDENILTKYMLSSIFTSGLFITAFSIFREERGGVVSSKSGLYIYFFTS